MGTVYSMPPKTDRRVHRTTPYILTYVPASGEWSWSFKIVLETEVSGTKPTYEAAMADAKDHIDLSMGVPWMS